MKKRGLIEGAFATQTEPRMLDVKMWVVAAVDKAEEGLGVLV